MTPRKLILSRKGFDSSNGDFPSAIIGNKLISLPIPQPEAINYRDIQFNGEHSIGKLLDDIKYVGCVSGHLDPDINKDSIDRKEGWRGSFGQTGASLTHLMNNNVGEGDIFLFYGWFKEAELDSLTGKYRYKRNSPDLNVIFGYLEIDEMIDIDAANLHKIPGWLRYHPHVVFHDKYTSGNKIFIGKENSGIFDGKAGYGVFEMNENLILTKTNHSRSVWELPDIFFEKRDANYYCRLSGLQSDTGANISRKQDKSKPGYKIIQPSGRRLQEMVMDCNEDVIHWIKSFC